MLNPITFRPGTKYYVLGDFNASHPNWGSKWSNSGEKLLNWIIKSDLYLLNHQAYTHVGKNSTFSSLDISLCSPCLAPHLLWKVGPDLLGSDHFPIFINPRLQDTEAQYVYHQFNWNHFNNLINQQQNEIMDYRTFKDTFQSALQRSNKIIPLPAPRIPWWTPTCGFIRANMRRNLNKAKRKLNCTAWNKYLQLKTKLKNLLTRLKQNYWAKVCKQAVQSKSIYKIMKSLNSHHDYNITSFHRISIDGKLVKSAREIANAFGDHFLPVLDQTKLNFNFTDYQNDEINNPFTIEELTKAISRTRSSAPGLDGITQKMVANLSSSNRNNLLYLYNISYATGIIPSDWTHAVIIPVCKPHKDPQQISSYRPISLTSVLAKIMERMMLNRLLQKTYYNANLFHESIHGFLPFRGCHTAQAQIYQKITQAKKRKEYFLLASLDIKSAYDMVWRDGLISKMIKYGIKGKIVKWIYNFLHNRTGQVKWRNIYSNMQPNHRGIPQGSVLSAYLFAFFLLDFHKCLPKEVQAVIYADDIFLYVSHPDLIRAQQYLQQAINAASNWCRRWKLDLSRDKCQIINFSSRRKQPNMQFHIQNQIIPEVRHMKILGVIFDRNLTWKLHFQHLRQKSMKSLNCFKYITSSKWGITSKNLLQIGNATIRSQFDFGGHVFCGAAETQYKKILPVYHSMIRLATGMNIFTPLPVLYAESGSQNLRLRHLMLRDRFLITHLKMNKWSPINSVLHSPQSNLGISTPGTNSSLTDRLRTVLQDFGINQADIISWTPPLDQSYYTIYTHELPFQEKNMPEKEIQIEFNKFIAQNPDFYIIGTDGAKTDTTTSIGYVFPHCGISQGRMTSIYNSIFTAEAQAVKEGIINCIRADKKQYIIFTDSQGVLKSLKNINYKSPSIITQLHCILNKASATNKIYLIWTPGHRGIWINEQADRATKTVTISDSITEVSGEDICHSLLVQFHKENKSLWTNYPKRHFYPHIDPDHVWFHEVKLNRTNQVRIQRLRTNTLLTNSLLHRVHLTDNPNCRRCNIPETIEHIFFECPTYENSRINLWLSLQWDTSPPSVPDLLCSKSPDMYTALAEFLHGSLRFAF